MVPASLPDNERMEFTEQVDLDEDWSYQNSRIQWKSELYKIHYNLFITQFVITRFWILNGSKMDPRNV